MVILGEKILILAPVVRLCQEIHFVLQFQPLPGWNLMEGVLLHLLWPGHRLKSNFKRGTLTIGNFLCISCELCDTKVCRLPSLYSRSQIHHFHSFVPLMDSCMFMQLQVWFWFMFDCTLVIVSVAFEHGSTLSYIIFTNF